MASDFEGYANMDICGATGKLDGAIFHGANAKRNYYLYRYFCYRYT